MLSKNFSKLKKLLLNNRLEVFILLLIIALAAFLRSYKLDQYMTFLGDEGRDAIVIKKLLTNFDLVLLGPPTSVGNMYLGPLYYYMMAVPMGIFWLNPIAAAGMNALIGILTVGLIFYLSRQWFGKISAILSAALYAISPVTVLYSRSSWNPNPAPFFSLLGILGFYLMHKKNNPRWLILTGIATAFAVQMHYLALILLPIFALLWLVELFRLIKQKSDKSSFLKNSLFAFLAFLFLMSPLAIFDFRHNFINLHAFESFFNNKDQSVSFNGLDTILRITSLYANNLIGRHLGLEGIFANFVALLLLSPLVIGIYDKIKTKKISWPILALLIWGVVGLFGLSFYKYSVYDHYLGFLNPIPFFLFGAVYKTVNQLIKNKLKFLVFGAIFILFLIISFYCFQKNPFSKPPSNQLQRTQDIAKFIILQAEDKPFNFALMAERNYDSAYQFYLDIYNHKPKQVPFDITDQLFVVCEDPVCQPINNPKYEIVGFGWSKVESIKEFSGIKVYKLIHNPSGKP